jgi:hypothetical protein
MPVTLILAAGGIYGFTQGSLKMACSANIFLLPSIPHKTSYSSVKSLGEIKVILVNFYIKN